MHYLNPVFLNVDQTEIESTTTLSNSSVIKNVRYIDQLLVCLVALELSCTTDVMVFKVAEAYTMDGLFFQELNITNAVLQVLFCASNNDIPLYHNVL